MKCMPENLINAASATSEDAEYPASNVLGDSQLVPWKATAQTATLTLQVDPGANGVGLVGIANVLTAVITLKDAYGATVETTTFDLSGIEDYLTWMTETGMQRTSCGWVYTYQSDIHTIEIALDSGSATLFPEVGKAGAGGVMTWKEPLALNMSTEEIGAIVGQFYDGGRYYVAGEAVKVFSGSLRHDLDTEFWPWILQLSERIKTAPCFWWVTDQNDVNWLVFARFNSMPQTSVKNLNTITNFELVEDKG